MKTIYYAYALVSQKDGSLYIGMTSDISRRLREHNAGYNRSTAAHRPYRIVTCQTFADRAEARKQEKQWKTAAGRERLKQLNHHQQQTKL